ncbi:MAG: site-specific DNA-methyltransferase [archaeon]
MKTSHHIYFKDASCMEDVPDESVNLVITSPPYPMIEMWDDMFTKADPAIGSLFRSLESSQSEDDVSKIYSRMHLYLGKVWSECFRVLANGGIACINIGDATRNINGNYRLFPNHSRILHAFDNLGFITLPYVLWSKPTNKPNAFLGSGFLPPNAYVTVDAEYILIFRKGGLRHFTPHHRIRYASKFTKAERDTWFSQIWTLKGAKQQNPAILRRTGAYPQEISDRLVKMFSIAGDTILDPFLGTGTTIKSAIAHGRSSIGYEIDKSLKPVIKQKLGISAEVGLSD